MSDIGANVRLGEDAVRDVALAYRLLKQSLEEWIKEIDLGGPLILGIGLPDVSLD